MYFVVIYYGQETQLVDRPTLNHTTKVVLTLVEPLANLGYDVYTDRFYTSPALALALAEVNTTLTGTVMRNKKDLPLAVKCIGRTRGQTNTYKKGNMVVTIWTDKRTLVSLSTKHSNRMVEVPSR